MRGRYGVSPEWAALRWMAVVAVGVLLIYALALLGRALFDGPPAIDERYRACIEVGGSYSNGTGSSYACEVP